MNNTRFFLILILVIQLLPAWSSSYGFVTPKDVLENEPSSNIILRNNSAQDKTIYGLYVRQLSSVAPGDTCDHGTLIYPVSGGVTIPPNITAGSFVTPTLAAAGKSTVVGKNYLYNMIYQSSYYVNIQYSSSPPGCSLPGCTWGSDTTHYNWCVYLGALGPVASTSGYSSNIPPSTELASSTGTYDYNLIDTADYVTLGPIVCDDQALTCVVANQQIQTIQ